MIAQDNGNHTKGQRYPRRLMKNSTILSLISTTVILCVSFSVDLWADQKTRAAEFKQVLQKQSTSCAVYIYKRSIEKYSADELAALVDQFGFDTVYLSISATRLAADKKYQESTRRLLAAFHKKQITPQAILLDHKVLYEPERIPAAVDAYAAFNKGSKSGHGFAGINADIEPHILKKGRDFVPQSFPWRWSSDSYGIDKDNDQLMKKVISSLKESRQLLDKDNTLSQAIPHFFHHHAVSGDMSCGKASDFLKHCSEIIIMAYNANPDKVLSYCKDELKQAGKKKCVTIAVKTSLNTKGGGGDPTSFQKAGWQEFLVSLDTIITGAKKHSAFKGMALFELEGFLKLSGH